MPTCPPGQQPVQEQRSAALSHQNNAVLIWSTGRCRLQEPCGCCRSVWPAFVPEFEIRDYSGFLLLTFIARASSLAALCCADLTACSAVQPCATAFCASENGDRSRVRDVNTLYSRERRALLTCRGYALPLGRCSTSRSDAGKIRAKGETLHCVHIPCQRRARSVGNDEGRRVQQVNEVLGF